MKKTPGIVLIVTCFTLYLALAAVRCTPASTPAPTIATESSATPTSVPPTATPTPATAAESPASPTPIPPTTTSASPSEPTWKADGLIGDGEYPHAIEIAGIAFHWTNDEENLYGAVAAETNGWVSVGFDPETQMKGANFVFGYVQDGTAFVQDMFGTKPTGRASHPPDEELGGRNDVLEYAGREEGNVTTIEFKIPLDSGDQYDKPLSPGTTYAIILALGPSDDLDSRHVAEGYGEITLD